jgi:tetratricopeptide (TPR) repeat protein
MEAASTLGRTPPPTGPPGAGAVHAGASRRLAHSALWLVAGVIALVLVWRIVVVNVSAMFALEAETTPSAAASAVAWDGANGDALMREADTLVDRDPRRAQELAHRALAANPASARTYLVLARLAAAAGDTRAYAAALARSAELEPQSAPTRLALAELALQQNDAGSALVNLDAAIRARPELAPELYPQMLALLATDAGETELRKVLARRIPVWWPAFFAYASAQGATPIVPLRLLDIRRNFDPSPGVTERQPVIARLAREGEWLPAFFVWLNGLTPEQRRAAGNVHNGGFEMPFTATTFDWRWPMRNGVEIEALPTFGTSGARAMRLAFQGQVVSPQLIAQTLLLDPGYAYELRARYRLESLRSPFGVQWEISCGATGSRQSLADGDRMVGTTDWSDFAVKFVVPANCYPQQLSLILRGDAKLDLQATGLAWFDDMQIVRGIAVGLSKSTASTVSNSPASAGGEAGSRRMNSRNRE